MSARASLSSAFDEEPNFNKGRYSLPSSPRASTSTVDRNAVDLSSRGLYINHQLTSGRRSSNNGESSHTYSKDETSAFTNFINSRIENDQLLTRHYPIDADTEEIFTKLGDGLVLTRLINSSFPSTIDETKVNKQVNMNVYQKLENLSIALAGAKKIGCQLVNIGGKLPIYSSCILIRFSIFNCIYTLLQEKTSLLEGKLTHIIKYTVVSLIPLLFVLVYSVPPLSLAFYGKSLSYSSCHTSLSLPHTSCRCSVH